MFQFMAILICSQYRSNNARLIKTIILLTMIHNITNKKVVYSKLSGAFTFADNDWFQFNTFSALFSVITCGTSNILSVNNYSKIDNSMFSRIFKLEPHYQITFSFKFWRIDTWNNKLFEVFVDLENQYSRSFSDSDTTTNICQVSSISDSVIDVSINIQHSNPTLQIILKGQGSFWGISDFELAIDECAPGCDSCNQSQCFNQKLVPISIQWITMDMFSTQIGCLDYRYDWTYGTFMEIEIDLEYHIKISSKMRFLITNSDNPTLTIKIDDQLVTTTQKLSQRIIWTRSFCNHIQILDVKITDLVHTNPKIKIRVDVVMPEFEATEGSPFLGRPDFELFITTSEKQINTDSQGLPYEGCQLDIPELFEGCSFCVRGICLHCQEGWQYIEQDQECQPICGDFKLVQNEECDDGNLIPYDGCYQCQYSCPLFCKQCINGKCIQCEQPQQLINGLCLFVCNQIKIYSVQQYTGCFNHIDNIQDNGYYQHILFNQDNLKLFQNEFLDCNLLNYGIFGFNFNQCRLHNIQLCKNQSWAICLECIDGFQLTKSKQQCISICNDGQIVEFEVCDDGNVIQFDGCYKCQLSCQLECSNCVNQQCLRCIEGWDLIENQCLPNCGDGITVQTEQCDDGNQEVGDGCYECQAECPYCEICNYYNKCQVCQEHFHSVQQICLPICGDNYVESGLEECDDGNQIQYDGCYNCQLECDIRCQKCYYGQCKDICKYDELEIDGKCFKFISEDKYTVNSYDCSKGCKECVEDECLFCWQNYILYRGLCYESECGNGIIEPLEDCDDGNSINNDGCSNQCKIEYNWNCFSKDQQVNQCFSITQASLEYLNQTNYYQYIKLLFSKKVILGNNSVIENFPEKDSFRIVGLKSDEYFIKCNPKVPISQNEFKNIQYEFQIYFYFQINSNLIFNIQLNETILDENQMLIFPTNLSIELKVPKILTISQLTASKTLKTIGHDMMISLSCSGFLMLILGKFSQIISLLDILQQQQFLKYLNVEYPQNVYVYFESSNFITWQPLLNYLNFPDLYQHIFSKQFQQSIGKFKEYQINADFLTNIDSLIFQIVVGCTFCLMIYLYEKYISKHISLVKIFHFIRNRRSKFIESIFIYLYKFKKKNLEIQKILCKENFIQFIYANSQDLIFKVGIFLNSNKNSEIRQRVSLLICFGYLGNIILILIFGVGKNKGLIKFTETIQLKHEKLILFKQLSFHFCLTQIQFYPILQSLLISIVNTSYIILILGFKFKITKIELITILSNEIPNTIFILLNTSYDYNFQVYLNLQQQIYIGFIQIGLLIVSLIGPFLSIIFECYSQWKKFKQQRTNIEIQNRISTNILTLAY